MSDEVVKNLTRSSAWFRILFMAGFALALYVSGVVLLVLMLAQIVFTLITGEDNINLRRLGSSLSAYVTQILAFLTYNSEQKPFPFMPFPEPQFADAETVVEEVVVEEEEIWTAAPDLQDDKAEPAVAESVVTESIVAESIVTEPAVDESVVTETVVTETVTVEVEPGAAETVTETVTETVIVETEAAKPDSDVRTPNRKSKTPGLEDTPADD